MKNLQIALLFSLLMIHEISFAQNIKLETKNLVANQVFISFEKLQRNDVVKVIKDSTIKEVDEATFVKIKDIKFKDGCIEVMVMSQLLKNAPPTARGFIGIAFRINDDNSKFECLYIRPTNGRADDQIRRNHAIQYFAFPDFKFPKLRKDTPEMYESYADMGLNEWIKMKIEVKGKQVRLFLNNNKQPSLIVNDLKLGENVVGNLGLFVDVGTVGYFKDLKITKF